MKLVQELKHNIHQGSGMRSKEVRPYIYLRPRGEEKPGLGFREREVVTDNRKRWWSGWKTAFLEVVVGYDEGEKETNQRD